MAKPLSAQLAELRGNRARRCWPRGDFGPDLRDRACDARRRAVPSGQLLAASGRPAGQWPTSTDSLQAVPTVNHEKYQKHARDAAVVFKEHGALKLVECWGDDVPDGKLTSFPMAVKRKEDETVVFSWITWPSREVRNEGMKKVMVDPRLKPDTNPMPFDGKRLIYGGFEVIVDE